MAIGYDNSDSDKIYCGTDIQPFLAADGHLSGLTCTSVYASGDVSGLIVNRATLTIPSGGQLEVIINHIGGTLTNACFTCSCHDCYDNPTQEMREKFWPFAGGDATNVNAAAAASPNLPGGAGIYSGYTFYPNTLGGSSLGGPGQFN